MTEEQNNIESERAKIEALEAKVAELERTIQDLRGAPEGGNDPSMKPFLKTLEQLSLMREDFMKLCDGVKGRVDNLTAKSVLSSFEAYQVDIENILMDAGVVIGHTGTDECDTIQQRVVDTIPTDDQDMNGRIAERLSEGYWFGDKVIVKEKVAIFRYTETVETNSETISKE